MTTQNQVRFNLDGLEDIKRKVGGSMRARVGVLGSNAARATGTSSQLAKRLGITSRGGTINNATLMLIHMFGSIKNNLPPRDALLMPIEYKRRELIQSLKTGSMRAAFNSGDYHKMFELLGVAAEGCVQEAFATGGFGLWEPLEKETVAAKGSSAILINYGELRRSVTSDVVTGTESSVVTLMPLTS